jgi:hypothetical protein
MQHLSLFALFLFVSIISFGQDIDPFTLKPSDYLYYPVNKIIKNNRIHSVTDSSEFILPGKFRTRVYDTLGRIIGEISRPNTALDNPYIYRQSGDTTYRLKYNADKAVLHSYQRFVLNKKGQIISYLDCGNYYLKDDSYYAGYEAFYYDDNGQLITKLSYTREDCPGKMDDKIIISSTALVLNDVINYTYKTLPNGNKLVIGKHAIGKPDWRATDSTMYDKQNRIIRFNSFSKVSALGERIGNNVNNITEYQYTNTSVKIINFTTYCYMLDKNIGCLSAVETDKDTSLIIYNFNKTLNTIYGFNLSGQRYLRDQYVYTYY